MFSSQASPIAIDFGSSSVKLLQISSSEPARLVQAAEIAVPEAIRREPDERFDLYAREIPEILSKAKFKGRRITLAIPSTQTFIQHMQFAPIAGASYDDLIKDQLHAQIGCLPDSVIVRAVEVGEVHRGGQAQVEIICLATARDTVMQFVRMLKRCKLDVVGVHTESLGLIRAFDHINRRDSDSDVTTLYVDMGWSGTNVAIAHGREIKFARHIQLGGHHFDQHIATTLQCDMVTAHDHRMSLSESDPAMIAARPRSQPMDASSSTLGVAESAHNAERARADAPAGTATTEERRPASIPASTCLEVPSGDPPRKAANVDLTELLDTMTDELAMCLRYHQGIFPERVIDRSIFVGGEARQAWLCQHVVRALQLPAQLGDPLSRLDRDDDLDTPGLSLDVPQPGWAVAYGLCHAPTDL